MKDRMATIPKSATRPDISPIMIGPPNSSVLRLPVIICPT